MFGFTKELSLNILEYCNVHDFVNISHVSKENLKDVQYYFESKRKIYKNSGIKKTIHNCLLKLKFCCEETDEIEYEIIKVVKKKFLEEKSIIGKRKCFRIYYWCISSPAIIGSQENGYKYVIYPNHCDISEELINDKNLIPFC